MIVVMGVSGVGKSTIGAALAVRLAARFVDADDLHSAAALARMASGVPLDSTDRLPWLRAMQALIAAHDRARPLVLACSALTRALRDGLRASGADTPLLTGPTAAIAARLQSRTGHFMRADMLASQLAAFEPPTPAERDIVALAADTPPEAVVTRALALIARAEK